MATSAKVALRPENEAARNVIADVRATIDLINYGNDHPTAFPLRLQFLRNRNVGAPMLSILAALAWEVGHGTR